MDEHGINRIIKLQRYLIHNDKTTRKNKYLNNDIVVDLSCVYQTRIF
jgi:hypothetical protein